MERLNAILLFTVTVALSACQASDNKSETEAYGSSTFEQPVIANFNLDSAEKRIQKLYETRANLPKQHSSSNNTIPSFDYVKANFKYYCNNCHNESGRAPFTFNSYNQLKRKSKTILDALEARVMPPWLVTSPSSNYCNDQSLPDSVRIKLTNWFNAGLPSELSKIEKNQLFEDSVELRYPRSLIVTNNVEHVLTTDSDTYVCSVYDPQLLADTFASGFSFESTSPDIIHHFTVFMDTIGYLNSLPEFWNANDGIISLDSLVPIDGWTRGMNDIQLDSSLAYRVPKNAKFLVETHFNGYGNKGRSEKTNLVMFLSNKPKSYAEWMIVQNQEFSIPKQEIKTLSISHKFDENTTLLGVFPHLHFLGRDVEVYTVSPEGKATPIVSISNWDYLLQGKFMLSAPLELKAGSSIVMTAVFDNTSNNPNQPNNPIRDVNWGRTGYNEMLVLMVYFSKQQFVGECAAKIVP